MTPLTPRQTEILTLIRTFMERSGRPPTRAELAEHFGFRSPNAAEEHLRALARKGAIELVPGAARGIRLKEVGLPIVGRVAAGSPILAQEHIDAYVRFDAGWFRPRADYLLKVQGMSMRDDEVTVKRYRQRAHEVTLLPENPDFEPIRVDLRERSMVIEGVVIGVIRNGL